jgi:heat shock protein 4
VTRLFNETSAVALSYGIFRRSQLSKDPKNVVFVDLGNSKLSAFCASFTNEKCCILAEAHARNTGCRNIDWDLLKHFSGKFKDQYGCDPMKNEKAKLRMLDAIEKLRKLLSANSEGSINIECLMEDEDLFYSLKREELEALIQPMLEVIK